MFLTYNRRFQNSPRKSSGVTTDSRRVERNNIYFALRGENFDGNKFAAQALAQGALAAVVDDAAVATSDAYVLVPDVLQALQALARMHRQRMRARVVALTGSNGKTTTKELISAVLRTSYRIINTEGNLNNHIGVPLTLLRIQDDTEIAVVEMGANHVGEIDFLCRIALPDAGLITNIGKAHLEGFGSFEGVIKAKTEMYRFLAERNGTIFVNTHDDLLLKHLPANNDVNTYGVKDAEIIGRIEKSDSVLQFSWQRMHAASVFTVQTQMPGDYNFPNFMAALAVGNYFHVAPELMNAALMGYTSTNKRSQMVETGRNRVLLDAYNANPTSMEMALRNFAGMPNAFLILGDMFELGEYSEEEHMNLLNLAKSLGFQQGIFIGKWFYACKHVGVFQYFETVADAVQCLQAQQLSGHTVLVKASRGMALEKLLDLL